MIKTELGYKHNIIFTILQALNKSGHGDPAYHVADAIYQYNCLVERGIIHEEEEKTAMGDFNTRMYDVAAHPYEEEEPEGWEESMRMLDMMMINP